MSIDISFKIGGEAGQGLQTIGYILAKSMARGGLYVFTNQDNESRIRGGHNFYQIRISDNKIENLAEKIQVIIAMDEQSITEHKDELIKNGVIIFDGEKINVKEDKKNLLSVPFERLAKEKSGSTKMANSVAIGAAISLVGYDFDLLESVLKDEFGSKGAEISDKNIQAANAGFSYVLENGIDEFPYKLRKIADSQNFLFLNGNEAVASAALLSGCKFVSGYPMSPSTPIQQFFASKMKDYGVVFEQAEDEISAINMIIGASFAGARSMTATSGGGFSLMVEGLSLSGMTETPIVIIICERPGPATGFPTRTEQGELEFAIYAGHGEFPRAVFAPGNVDQAFYLTSKAFNLAEKYQIPVIILSDQYLADSYFTTERFDISSLKVDRGEFFTESHLKKLGEYKRHLITESGISPRLFPGQKLGLVVTDSDEHTEDGHITELADVKIKNVNKRFKKLEILRKDIGTPFVYGSKDADTMLIGWGSTYGALKEAIKILNDKGSNVKMLHLSEIWPFPIEAVNNELKNFDNKISVESNSTGQMAHLIRAETGIEVNKKILRFDGRPITPQYIVREFGRIR
ncbi:2-oxoacid:acceptor oxidoreductase subunit alpha [[Eubacterium] cellulosolvens]